MSFVFSSNGLLTPAEGIVTTHEAFKSCFVTGNYASTRRTQLFSLYEEWLSELQSLFTPVLEIWINGSFVTHKPNPNDLDLVVFMDFHNLLEKETLFEQTCYKYYKQSPKLDIRGVCVLPEWHPDYQGYRHLLQYWELLFSKSRRLPLSFKRYPKGYLMISYDDFLS